MKWESHYHFPYRVVGWIDEIMLAPIYRLPDSNSVWVGITGALTCRTGEVASRQQGDSASEAGAGWDLRRVLRGLASWIRGIPGLVSKPTVMKLSQPQLQGDENWTGHMWGHEHSRACCPREQRFWTRNAGTTETIFQRDFYDSHC